MIGVPDFLVAEAAVGFVCAALVGLYGRSRGRDYIERWTVALVMLGAAATTRILAGTLESFVSLWMAVTAVFFVLFALEVGAGTAEFTLRRKFHTLSHRKLALFGALGILSLVHASSEPMMPWILALGFGGFVALGSGALVLRHNWDSFGLGGVVFAILACGGGAAQLVAAGSLAETPSLDLGGSIAVASTAVVLALVIGILDDARASALSVAKEVEHLAYHDPLTGLPNRSLFVDRLTQALAQRKRQGNRCGVLFIDLDRFKAINDSLGHAAGDELLQTVAERVGHLIRNSDTLSRFGGDEFTLLLPNIESPDDAVRVAKKITDGIPERIVLAGRDLFVTCSVGVAIAPEDGDDPDTLISNADAAMYRAKELGRNTYQLYEPSMNAETLARLDLESRLRKGVEDDELVMHYQPAIDRKTARVVLVEALVRWQHPELGLLLPSNFLGVAERSGLIHSLGEWVIRRTCRDANRIRSTFGDSIVVSVNVSAIQVLAPGFVERLKSALEETKLPSANLSIEVNESKGLNDLLTLSKVLTSIRELGVQVAIDDFGAGLSSVTTLAQLPHDSFKLDQSLVAQLDQPGGEDLARAVLNLAKAMGKPVTAEGVENESQLSLLAGLGCDRIQGNLIGTPVPLETLLSARSNEYRTSRLMKELVQRAGYITLERSRPIRDFASSIEHSQN